MNMTLCAGAMNIDTVQVPSSLPTTAPLPPASPPKSPAKVNTMRTSFTEGISLRTLQPAQSAAPPPEPAPPSPPADPRQSDQSEEEGSESMEDEEDFFESQPQIAHTSPPDVLTANRQVFTVSVSKKRDKCLGRPQTCWRPADNNSLT